MVSIYVVSHKPINLLDQLPEDYIPYYVGPIRATISSQGGICDGLGDNIAGRNSSFCELTALYYIWKNDECNIKGLVHYRRFFKDDVDGSILSIRNANRLLSNSDLIVPKKYWLLGTVEQHYKAHHNSADFNLLRDVLAKMYPQYLDAFVECANLKYLYPYNMLIACHEIFDSYCSWLFPLLFEFEKEAGNNVSIGYQSRIYGFLSERLTNVFITKNRIKVCELPVLLTETSLKRDISMGLAKLLYGRN